MNCGRYTRKKNLFSMGLGKNIIIFPILFLSFTILLTSCTAANPVLRSEQSATEASLSKFAYTETAAPDLSTKESLQVTDTSTPVVENTLPVTQSTTSETAIISTETNSMTTIIISIGNSSFSAKLYDNETTRALLAQFPLNLNMSELNGKEKYFSLPENLPTSLTEKPEIIHAGEIMVWSSNTLVLFYNTFSNSYSGYVKLGYVEDVTGLADALGGENIQVTFTISN